MPVPVYYEMHRPTLEALADGSVKTNKEINSYVKNYFDLSEEVLAELLPSGRQTTFLNRAGWSRTYLKKAGLISSPRRARFQITERGIETIKNGPEVIDDAYLSQYDGFTEFIQPSTIVKTKPSGRVQPPVEPSNAGSEDESPDDKFEKAFATINKSLESELIDEVMKLTPKAFEQFALDLLGRIGYGAFENAGHVTQYVADDGIDGVIKEDKLGFSLIYVQAKQWAPDRVISNSDIRNFVGALVGKDGKGLFITTARFSRSAIELARNRHIVLIDGQKMAELMIEHNFGVSVQKVFEVKEIDSDVFDKYEMVEE